MLRSCLFLLMVVPASLAALADQPWVKLCEKATVAVAQQDRKPDHASLCLTYYQRVDKGGKIAVSAALREIEGLGKRQFMVMVPLGTFVSPGMRATIFSEDLWKRVRGNEKIDTKSQARLKGFTLLFTLFLAQGCTAEVEATPDLVTSLKRSGGLVVSTINEWGVRVATYIPLDGFARAFEGQPVLADALRNRRLPRPMRCDRGDWPGCPLL